VVAGFIALIRWQNILFALLPGSMPPCSDRRAGARRSARVRATLIASAAFLACSIAGFLPQMLAWQSIYGSLLARSPVGPQIRWTSPQLADILWSARNGLFSTAPVLYLAAAGLVLLSIARPAAGWPMIAAVAVMVYFNACIQDWWGSAGFGGRRFDGTIPLFAVGLAVFVEAAAAVVRRHAVAAVSAALARARHLEHRPDGSGAVGRSADRRNGAVRSRLGLAGAIRHRCSATRSAIRRTWSLRCATASRRGDYDMLRTNRFLADPLQPLRPHRHRRTRYDRHGAADDPVIGDGWYAPEREGPLTFRWGGVTRERPHPARPCGATARAAPHPRLRLSNAPAQTVTVIVNDRESNAPLCASVPVTPDWQTVECTADASAWRGGVNRLELRFAYAQRPVDVGAGGDTRRCPRRSTGSACRSRTEPGPPKRRRPRRRP
jgi:hypothetical protein